MKTMTHFKVLQVTWKSHQTALMSVREMVFIKEQYVPVGLEWDGLDEVATHLLVLDASSQAIACARILPSGHIGRMAVLKDWRGLGIGRAVLTHAIAFCQAQGFNTIQLSAQKHALGFYKQAGFVVSSSEYMDAGIPHYDMELSISV